MKKNELELNARLDEIYLECIEQKIPHFRRISLVRSRIADFIKRRSIYSTKEEEYATQWMKERCKADIDSIKPMALLSFFYDTEFWKISIPLIYGQVKLNPLDSLTDMPDYLKKILSENLEDYDNFISLWIDAIDLTYGLQELRYQDKDETKEFAKGLLLSGVQNLNAVTASLLFTESKNNQITMSLRIAIELFIKSYLIFKKDLRDDKDAQKKVGHDLKKGLNRIKKISPHLVIDEYLSILDLLPDISKRYEPQDNNLGYIPICYQLALYLASIITRSMTDRNISNRPI